jgi:hypothetical protein
MFENNIINITISNTLNIFFKLHMNITIQQIQNKDQHF